MAISDHARLTPDKPATIMAGSGRTVTYGELEERSIRLARVLRAAGIGTGDVVALLMENQPTYHEVYWATNRSGMLLCPVNRYLTADEVAYILNDSGAKALIVSAELAEVASEAARHCDIPLKLAVDGAIDGFDAYEVVVAGADNSPLDDQPTGDFMGYSSGTTGRPKGIRRPLPAGQFTDITPFQALARDTFGFDEHTIYLSPAPLYHSAPLAYTATVHIFGGTNVVMERFDPIEALRLIEQHDITHAQFVPTMFVRMLKLEPEVRQRFDLSTLTVAIHAAAPCPVAVKQQMIDWWGPILWEYYGGTELNGLTMCNSDEWLEHPGTVGRAVFGTLHICDDDGNELPPGQPGAVYFEQATQPFEYHNDPDKTEGSQHPTQPLWTKLGDVGYMDDDDFLHLTDRESFMIIAGGVNIYPQEIEDRLILHPAVEDVAVFGIPHPDMGEEVKAVVQLTKAARLRQAHLEQELLDYARQHLAGYKVPRSIDFDDQLPRLETGKLYKRLLRDRFWGNAESRIV